MTPQRTEPGCPSPGPAFRAARWERQRPTAPRETRGHARPGLKLPGSVLCAIGIATAVGCANPNYHYTVTDNGQGSVTVTTAPYTGPAAQSSSTTSTTGDPQQRRIDQLEAQIRQLSAENARLRHAPTTQPAP